MSTVVKLIKTKILKIKKFVEHKVSGNDKLIIRSKKKRKEKSKDD